MGESYIALPPDGSGKKVRSIASTIGSNEVHEQVIKLAANFSTYSATVTISGGSGSNATSSFAGNFLRHLLIKPTTSTTTYKFQITDADGFVIYDRTGGTTTGHFGLIIALPLSGIITIAFSSVSADENISVKMIYE